MRVNCLLKLSASRLEREKKEQNLTTIEASVTRSSNAGYMLPVPQARGITVLFFKSDVNVRSCTAALLRNNFVAITRSQKGYSRTP